jgi:hypothetical protein
MHSFDLAVVVTIGHDDARRAVAARRFVYAAWVLVERSGLRSSSRNHFSVLGR